MNNNDILIDYFDCLLHEPELHPKDVLNTPLDDALHAVTSVSPDTDSDLDTVLNTTLIIDTSSESLSLTFSTDTIAVGQRLITLLPVSALSGAVPESLSHVAAQRWLAGLQLLSVAQECQPGRLKSQLLSVCRGALAYG
ncbi:MAG: hypothetical protein VXZ05_08975 [Pseudomonadota bacterium]|nr:hypothetical protein [Pseudomonadota bacterium]